GRLRDVPEIRWIKHFPDDGGYIDALRASVADHWGRHGRGQCLLMSFHGLPRRNLDLGDPYHCECHKTARLLAQALGLAPSAYRVSFQSRFGRARWLEPSTVDTLRELAGRAPVKGRYDVGAADGSRINSPFSIRTRVPMIGPGLAGTVMVRNWPLSSRTSTS